MEDWLQIAEVLHLPLFGGEDRLSHLLRLSHPHVFQPSLARSSVLDNLFVVINLKDLVGSLFAGFLYGGDRFVLFVGLAVAAS